MAVAGSLLIEIGMNVARLQVDVDKARGSIYNMEKGVMNLKNAFGTLAAATGVILGLRKAWDLVDQSSQLQEQRQALANLAADYNVTSDVIISSMKKAADGTISQSDAIKIATKGMMIGLDPNQLIKFTEVAKVLGDALGKNIEDVLDTLERATVSGAKAEITLKKELGVIVDLDTAYQKYATTHHLLVSELTDETKRRITINELMLQSDNIINKLGTDTSTMADAMERFKATMADVKITLGEWIATTAAAFAGVMALVAAGGIEMWRQTIIWIDRLMAAVEGLWHWLRNLADLGAELPGIGIAFKFIADKLSILENEMKGNRAGLKEHSLNMGALIEDFDNMADKAFKLAGGIGKVTEGIKADLKPAVDELKPAFEAVNDAVELFKSQMIWQHDAAVATKKYNNELEKMKQLEIEAGMERSRWLTKSIYDYENATKALQKFQERQTPQQSLDKDIVSGFSPINAVIIGGMERLKVLKDFHKQEAELLIEKYDALYNIELFGENRREVLQQIQSEKNLNIKAAESHQSIQMKEMEYKVGLQMLGSSMSQLGQIMMQRGEENFEIGKTIAIAGVIVNTAAAVMSALAVQPYALGVALAIATAAFGALQLETIANQSYMGGGSAAASMSVPSMGATGGVSGGATTGAANSDFKKEKELPTQNITINVYNPMSGKVSDELADAIIAAINDAPDRNIRINAQAVN